MLNIADQLLQVSWEASMTVSGRKVAPSGPGKPRDPHSEHENTVIYPRNCFLVVKQVNLGGHGGHW